MLGGERSLGTLTDDEMREIPLVAFAEELVVGPAQGEVPLRRLIAVHPGQASGLKAPS